MNFLGFGKKKPEPEVRIVELQEGDAALIIKASGKTQVVQSGMQAIQQSDRLAFMLMLYIANPEYVALLEQLFEEALDSVEADFAKKNGVVMEGQYNNA